MSDNVSVPLFRWKLIFNRPDFYTSNPGGRPFGSNPQRFVEIIRIDQKKSAERFFCSVSKSERSKAQSEGSWVNQSSNMARPCN